VNVRFRVNFGQGSKGGASSLVEALKDETPSIRTNVKPLSMLGIDTGKSLNMVAAWRREPRRERCLSLWIVIRVIDSQREVAKRLKTNGWLSWNASSTRSLVDGVSWSSLAGGALRSAQAGGRWPSG